MKKKNVFTGIGMIIIMAMALSYNVSSPKQDSDISLLSIKAMTNAMAECTGASVEGATCYTFDNGTDRCLFGGEVGVYCP